MQTTTYTTAAATQIEIHNMVHKVGALVKAERNPAIRAALLAVHGSLFKAEREMIGVVEQAD